MLAHAMKARSCSKSASASCVSTARSTFRPRDSRSDCQSSNRPAACVIPVPSQPFATVEDAQIGNVCGFRPAYKRFDGGKIALLNSRMDVFRAATSRSLSARKAANLEGVANSAVSAGMRSTVPESATHTHDAMPLCQIGRFAGQVRAASVENNNRKRFMPYAPYPADIGQARGKPHDETFNPGNGDRRARTISQRPGNGGEHDIGQTVEWPSVGRGSGSGVSIRIRSRPESASPSNASWIDFSQPRPC